MKKTNIFLAALVAINLSAQEVIDQDALRGRFGLNTQTPRVTVDLNVAPINIDTDRPEGIIIPSVTRKRAQDMGTNVPNSTMVYITEAETGTQSDTTQNVDGKGFYYFTDSKWLPLQSEFVKLQKGYGLRERLDYKYLKTGYGAIDFSTVRAGESSSFGAEGDFSIAMGYEGWARATRAVAIQNNAYSAYEIAIGRGSEDYIPSSKTEWIDTDRLFVIGNSKSDDKGDIIKNPTHALTVWKNAMFKWQSRPLSEITNPEKGGHAQDENGNLNIHDGTNWKKYISVSFSSSIPNNAQQGDMYFNTTEKKYYAFDGMGWKALW